MQRVSSHSCETLRELLPDLITVLLLAGCSSKQVIYLQTARSSFLSPKTGIPIVGNKFLDLWSVPILQCVIPGFRAINLT